jgi:hypothetical protein
MPVVMRHCRDRLTTDRIGTRPFASRRDDHARMTRNLHAARRGFAVMSRHPHSASSKTSNLMRSTADFC